MALRRRRKKLTSLMSSVDKRLKNVELRSSKGYVPASVDPEDNNNIIEPPPGVVNTNSPNPWVHVVGGYWYPTRTTGAAKDRIEIWFDADPLIEKDYGMTVSGVTVTDGWTNPSGTFKVLGDDYPWADPDRKDWYVPLGSGVTNTALYTTDALSETFPWIYGFQTNAALKTRAAISTTQATTTVATISFSGGHHFKTGDIVSVSDLYGTSYYDIDGIVRVASADSTTITYNFNSALANAIPLANVTSKYVYGVAQKEVRVGATWVDADGITYYWNGIRYVKWTEGSLPNDGVAPSPPTELVLTTVGYNLQGGASGARSKVTLSWTAPTTNVNDKPLDDLVGYRVWFRNSPSVDWVKLTYGQETTQTIENLDPNVTYYFTVVAYDSSGLDSTGLTGSILTGTAAPTAGVSTPTAPILSSPRLGTVTVTWDGYNADGTLTDIYKLSYIEVHASTTSDFTPVSGVNTATIVSAVGTGTSGTTVTYTTSFNHGFSANQTVSITGMSLPQFNLSNVKIAATPSGTTFTVTVAAGTVQGTPTGQTGLARTGTLKGKLYSSSDSLIVTDLPYNVAYYFKFVSVDVSGNVTEASAQATTTIKPLVDADLIAAQLNAPLTNWPFANAAITAGALASGAVNASNMFGANVVVQSAIAANAIGANQIAAGAIVAGKIAANAVVAASIQALSISADKIATNAVTADKINAGSITAVKIAANAITAEKILATETIGFQTLDALQSVKLGANSVSSQPQTPGMAITETTYSNGIPTTATTGWVGAWGGGSMEIGTDFFGCYMDFFTSNTISMYADSGISITAISGGINHYGRVRNYDDTYLDGMSIRNSGAPGSGRYALYLNNSLNRIEGYNLTSSSIRYKTEVSALALDSVVESVCKLNPVTYKYRPEVTSRPDYVDVGFIAEELAEDPILARFVEYTDSGEPDGIRYDKLTVLLAAAVQKLNERITYLESKVD